jgi:hypothetical protein
MPANGQTEAGVTVPDTHTPNHSNYMMPAHQAGREAGFQIMITESRFDRHDLYNCV